jgi:hypothetical protein
MAEQFPCKGNNEVSGVAAFLLLHFAGHLKHFGSGVLHFELFENGCGITRDEGLIDVVDHHLFES